MILQIFSFTLLSIITIICIYDTYNTNKLLNDIKNSNKKIQKDLKNEFIKKENILKYNGYDII